MVRSQYFIIFFLLVNLASYGQKKTRGQLESAKKQNEVKLAEAKRILEETKKEKKTSVKQLKVIDQQLNVKSQQIELIAEDLEILESELEELEGASLILEKDLKHLQSEYSEMLYESAKKSKKLNQLGFLFAAPSFNQLAMRVKYLDQYTQTRKVQLKQIQRVRILLAERQSELGGKRKYKQAALVNQKVATESLGKIKAEKEGVISELSSKEKEIKTEVDARQRSINKLEGAIANLVNREVKKRNKLIEARAEYNKTASKNEKIEVEFKETIKLEGDFAAMKTRLKWPTKSGFVSESFGVHAHPVLKSVKVRNDGVDIQTTANATVHVVYDGIVRDIAEIPSLGTVIAVQHGEFFTVYAKLKNAFVSVNQSLKAGETIGVAGKWEGSSEINFQIWHNTTKLNPEAWLARR